MEKNVGEKKIKTYDLEVAYDKAMKKLKEFRDDETAQAALDAYSGVMERFLAQNPQVQEFLASLPTDYGMDGYSRKFHNFSADLLTDLAEKARGLEDKENRLAADEKLKTRIDLNTGSKGLDK